MGKRGPAPKPTHLKVLSGTREDRLNRDEPTPGADAVVPPVDLPQDAQAVWNRLAPDLIAKRVLTAWDVDAFAEFCRSVAIYNRAALEVESLPLTARGAAGGVTVQPAFRVMQAAAQMMRSTGQRFGLTPGDRAALKVNSGESTKGGGERLLG